MQWQFPQPGQSGKDHMAPRSVSAPRDGEGIGNALRSVYSSSEPDMPRDMAALLDQLR